MNCCQSDHNEPDQKNNLPVAKKTSLENKFPTEQAKNGAGLAKSSLVLGLALVLIAGLAFGYFIKPSSSEDHLAMIKAMSIADQRTSWMSIADNVRGQLAMEGKYDCCLEAPCWYCIQKTPGHGEGAECTCRQDILNGLHPCGECIGEILEGHGLAELKPYYAKAIAHKVGAQHEAHLQDIINDMYPN